MAEFVAKIVSHGNQKAYNVGPATREFFPPCFSNP